MLAADPLVIDCPAKVNLALSVGAPDPGTGLHPIASWMSLVEFGDTLSLQREDASASRFVMGYAPSAPRVGVVDWPLEKDLAYRAHGLLEKHIGHDLPIRASLIKRIPTGAGLGGGSSDAAAMLVGLNRLFGLAVSTDELAALAAQLGSDVVFLTRALAGGFSAAVVGGFGERVEPLPASPPIDLTLIFPHHHSPTGAVYGAFDERAAGESADMDRVRALAMARPVDPAELFNDLAEPAMSVTPELRTVKEQVERTLGKPVHVTGSGAAMFVVADSDAAGDEMARQVTDATGAAAIATSTLA